MRSYYVYIPGEPVRILSNVRKLKDLPEGTHIEVDCEYDSYPLPVKDGKPDFKRGKAKHRARVL